MSIKNCKVIIVKNEQHTLLKEQKVILESKFSEYEYLNIYKEGISIKEQLEIIKYLLKKKVDIIFLSPIPLMLGKLSKYSQNSVYVFTNSKRNKSEKNGKITFNIENSGWKLLKI
ncbi:hypothetical protein GNF40_06875 [Clostridium perfringens]|uniref:hypothetical protein n=1 Tax=Clostridium perfringens TaxID=1502 RepID=UPI002AC52CEC|nr:hypothetical protein [Clostridium perfringens]MDZ5005859.1 hypothetical protein [Clostridium perfringens]